MSESNPHSFLANYKILDLSQYIPGPYATRQLADLGADVIKVEPPEGDPMRHFMASQDSNILHEDRVPSPLYQHLNRGKRIVKINLKQQSGVKLLSKLIKNADVLLESYRPGVLAKLGFDRATLNQLNPKLVHCVISGFGQNGPYSQKAGHDLTYCALSGALSNSNNVQPHISFPPAADHAGAMQAANTILAALLGRTHSNAGAFIDISLYEASLAWQYMKFHSSSPDNETLLLTGGAACYNIYQTSDKRFIALAPLETKFWKAFCEAVSKPQWINRQTESLPQTDLIQAISELFKTKPLSHWNDVLNGVDCCYEPILFPDEVITHPQVIKRDALNDVYPRYPAWINDVPVINEEVCCELSYQADTEVDIDWLKQK